MNIIFIIEENEYQFDVSNDATVKYIKELAEKIFKYEERGLDLLYNEENIINYDDKLKINQLVHDDIKTKTIIFHLEKKDNTKNTMLSSNISTIDSNNNDKYYHSMRKKFLKFNVTYSKINEEISNFDVELNNTINNFKKQMKEFTQNILKVNETLKLFYCSDSYDKLNKIFEQKITQNLTEIDLKHLNRDIESYILNYKYLTTQHNFQINILDFLEEKIEVLKFINLNLFKTLNHNQYEDIVSFLDQIFSEIINSDIHIPRKSLEDIDEDNSHSTNGAYLNFNEFKKENLPKIEIKNYIHKEKLKKFSIVSKIRKTKRSSQLMKKNNSEILKNNISLSSNIQNRNSIIDNISSNKLPILDNNKSIELKTIDSSQLSSMNPENKKAKPSFRSSFLLNEKEINSKYKANSKIKDLDNSLIINKIKPKIMEKSDNRINIHLTENSIRNNIFDKTFISERRFTKKFPSPSAIKNMEKKFEKIDFDDIKGISDNNLLFIKKNESYKKLMRVSIKLHKDELIDIETNNKNNEHNENNNNNNENKEKKDIEMKKENKGIKENKEKKVRKKSKEKKVDKENKENNENKDNNANKDNNENKDKKEEKSEKKSNLKKDELKQNQSEISLSPIKKKLSIINNDLLSLRRKTKFSFLSTAKSNFKDDLKEESQIGRESLGKKQKLINFKDNVTNRTRNSLLNEGKTHIIYRNNSKKSIKTDSIEEEHLLNKNKKVNNKEQIEKLTKDLLVSNQNLKDKNSSKKHLIDLTKIQELNAEKEKEKEKEEKEILLDENDDNQSLNINDDEIKKRKKKLINKYDFII